MTSQDLPTSATNTPDWEALARYLSGESPADEVAQVQAFLASHPEDAQVLEQLSRFIDRIPKSIAGVDIEAALETARRARHDAVTIPIAQRRVFGRRAESGAGTRRSAAPWLMAAAAGLVLLLGGQLWRRSADSSNAVASAQPQVYTTGLGVIDSVRLSDGTRVVLAPESELVVPADYGRAGREVQLAGVGHFDVVHDERNPFTVRSGGAEIRDVGTVFTVRTDSAATVRVAVQEGKVFMRGAGEGVYLDAGDVGTVASTGDAVAMRGAAGEEEVAWTSGRLVFRESSLADVASELRRWYGVELRAADQATSSLRLTAEFRGEPIEQVISELTLALDVRVERTGDTLVVRSKGGKR